MYLLYLSSVYFIKSTLIFFIVIWFTSSWAWKICCPTYQGTESYPWFVGQKGGSLLLSLAQALSHPLALDSLNTCMVLEITFKSFWVNSALN